jgi:penicillin-binding protein 1A
LITAIWGGGDNPIIRFRSIAYGQGAYMALPIFGKYLTSIYNDPLYSVLANSTFEISDQALSAIDCEDYREKEFGSIKEYLDKKEETIGDFIRRIFNKKKSTDENKKENE